MQKNRVRLGSYLGARRELEAHLGCFGITKHGLLHALSVLYPHSIIKKSPYHPLAGPTSSTDELPTRMHTRGVRRGFKRSWSDDPYHNCHPVHQGALQRSRTAVRAKRVGKRQALHPPLTTHPAISRSVAPELCWGGCGCVWRSRGSTVVKVNIPDVSRNATSHGVKKRKALNLWS